MLHTLFLLLLTLNTELTNCFIKHAKRNIIHANQSKDMLNASLSQMESVQLGETLYWIDSTGKAPLADGNLSWWYCQLGFCGNMTGWLISLCSNNWLHFVFLKLV